MLSSQPWTLGQPACPKSYTLIVKTMHRWCCQAHHHAAAAPLAASLDKLLRNALLERQLQELLTGDALQDTPAMTLAAAKLLGGGPPSWPGVCYACNLMPDPGSSWCLVERTL